jgi:hypothetical protein
VAQLIEDMEVQQGGNNNGGNNANNGGNGARRTMDDFARLALFGVDSSITKPRVEVVTLILQASKQEMNRKRENLKKRLIRRVQNYRCSKIEWILRTTRKNLIGRRILP